MTSFIVIHVLIRRNSLTTVLDISCSVHGSSLQLSSSLKVVILTMLYSTGLKRKNDHFSRSWLCFKLKQPANLTFISGTILCMNATMDPDLLNLVQQHVHDIMKDVGKLTFEMQEDRERVSLILAEILSNLEEMETRLDRMHLEQEAIQRDLSQKVECVELRVSLLENQGKESENKENCYSSGQELANVTDERNSVLSICDKNSSKFLMK